MSRDYDSIVRQIVAAEEGLAATQAKLSDNAVYRENIQRRLEKLAGGQMETERRRRDLAAQVHGLFEEGVHAYREQLRKVVEATATRFFLKMTTEKDYAGLRINEDYGLTIDAVRTEAKALATKGRELLREHVAKAIGGAVGGVLWNARDDIGRLLRSLLEVLIKWLELAASLF